MIQGSSPGWKPHLIRQGDGQGGWILEETQYQILQWQQFRGWNGGYGVAQMDNGEVVVMGTCDPGKSLWYGGGGGEKTVIAFSKDRGDTWTELERVGDLTGRPMMLAALGGGNLTFVTGRRHFSADYGRTWTESVSVPPASNGGSWCVEGNPLVDRDEQGKVTRMAETGWNYGSGKAPGHPGYGFIRWSEDGGRTWTDETQPSTWLWEETYEGETYQRGVSEGGLVRADNGWLVAALRTDMPAYYINRPHSDQMEGTGISISQDNGQSWSPIQVLFQGGRMHATLVKVPDGDLVLTVTVRHDIEDGELASYRRGCEAVVSHDNGLTWDLERKYILDEWEFYDSFSPVVGQCGHL